MKKVASIISILFSLTNSQIAQAQGNNATSKENQDTYLNSVAKLLDGCNSCGNKQGVALLIYDASCHQFLYRNGDDTIFYLKKTTEFKIKVHEPIILKIINLNRYLYDVNMGNSDVVFTSTQSQLLQQHLLPGSSTAEPQQAPTHADGSSANMGDHIFNLIYSFKPELDRIGIHLESIGDNIKDNATEAAEKTRELKTIIVDSKKTKIFGEKISEMTILNNYNNKLDEKATKLQQTVTKLNQTSSYVDQKAIYSTEFIPALDSYLTSAKKIIDQINNNKDREAYKNIHNNSKFEQFEKTYEELEILKKTAEQELTSTENPQQVAVIETPEQKAQKILVREKLDSLRIKFTKLENFYNDLIDGKIRAYSLCTPTFPCCDEVLRLNQQHGDSKVVDTLSYRYFNSLLSEITIAFTTLRSAAKPIIAKAKMKEKSECKECPKVPDILKVSASDFTFDKDGKITGFKLGQSGEAVKPDAKKPANDEQEIKAALDSFEKMWYNFEKAVSPDFFMKQILFRRNMIAKNMSYTSPPMYTYGDRLRLVFQIVASDSAKKNGVNLDEATIESLDFVVRGRPKFSFSAGTFAALGGAMYVPTYEFQQVPALGSNTVGPNSPYRLRQTGSGMPPIGACALANITGRIWNGFYLGGSIGVGVAVEPNVKVGYIVGTTASFGTYHQFHVTAGIIGMSVNELKNGYSTNVLYNEPPSGSLYTQRTRPGFLLALSYTVFNLKATGRVADGKISPITVN